MMAMKLSILLGLPVISNTKLSVVASTIVRPVGVGEAQCLGARLSGARHLHQRQFALQRFALCREVVDLVHRHQPLELRLDLQQH